MNGMPALDDLFRQRVDEALMAFGARDSLSDRALVVAAGLLTLGREIARLTGDADWNSESARAIIAALTADAQG